MVLLDSELIASLPMGSQPSALPIPRHESIPIVAHSRFVADRRQANMSVNG